MAMTPANGQRSTVATLPQDRYAASPSLSPDGRQFAVATFKVKPPEPGADLYLITRDGSEVKPLVSHVDAGGSLGYPTWSPDGAYIYATENASASPEGSWIVRVPAAGGPLEKLIQGANYPIISPDGKTLVFTKTNVTAGTGELRRANPDGSDAKPIPGTRFAGVLKPVFSPDGTTLGFSANADPLQPSTSSARLPFFGPGVALAHGVPWDAWTISVNGGTPQRRSSIREDQPVLAWSPDGKWLGMNGEVGLYLIRLTDGHVYRIADRVGTGLIWLGNSRSGAT
jgi:Tol biopolymer transport system component